MLVKIHIYKPLNETSRAVTRLESTNLNSLSITAWAQLCRFGEGSYALMPGCETKFSFKQGHFSSFFDWIVDEAVRLRNSTQGAGSEQAPTRRRLAG